MTNLDYEQQFEQDRHDAAHPGKVCGRCPRTLQDQADLYRRNAVYARREIWRDRLLAVLVLAALMGAWLVSGLIHS